MGIALKKQTTRNRGNIIERYAAMKVIQRCILTIICILFLPINVDAHRYYIGGQASLRYEDYLADYNNTSSYTRGFGGVLGLNFATYIYDPRLAIFSSGLNIDDIDYTTTGGGLRRYTTGYALNLTFLPDSSPLLSYIRDIYNEQDTGIGYLLRMRTFSYGLNWAIAVNSLPRFNIIFDKTRNETSGVPYIFKQDRTTSVVSFSQANRDNILTGQYQYISQNDLITNNNYTSKGLSINDNKTFNKTLHLYTGLNTYNFAFAYPSQTTISTDQLNVYTNLVNTPDWRITTNYFANYSTNAYSKGSSQGTQAGYNLYYRATNTISFLNGIYVIDSRSDGDAGTSSMDTEYLQGGITYLKPWDHYYVNAGYNIGVAMIQNPPVGQGLAHTHYFDGGIGSKDFKFFNVYNDLNYMITKYTQGSGNNLDDFRYLAQLYSAYFKPAYLQSTFTYEREFQKGFYNQYPFYNRLFNLIFSLPVSYVGLFSLTGGILNNSTPQAWYRNQYISTTLGITSIQNTAANIVFQYGFNSASNYPSSEYTRYEVYVTHNYRMLFLNIKGYLINQHIPGANSNVHGLIIQLGRNFGGYIGE